MNFYLSGCIIRCSRCGKVISDIDYEVRSYNWVDEVEAKKEERLGLCDDCRAIDYKKQCAQRKKRRVKSMGKEVSVYQTPFENALEEIRLHNKGEHFHYIKGVKIKCRDCGRLIKTVMYDDLKPIYRSKNELPEQESLVYDNFRDYYQLYVIPVGIRDEYVKYNMNTNSEHVIFEEKTAICEECMKNENYLVLDNYSVIFDWLKENMIFTEEIFFKTIWVYFRNNLNSSFLKVHTPAEYKKFANSDIRKNREPLRVYLNETFEYWRSYLKDLADAIADYLLESFDYSNNRVLSFLGQNKNLYFEIYPEDLYKFQEGSDSRAFEEIDLNVEKAKKRIKNTKKAITEAAKNCIEIIPSDVLKRELFYLFTELIANRQIKKYRVDNSLKTKLQKKKLQKLEEEEEEREKQREEFRRYVNENVICEFPPDELLSKFTLKDKLRKKQIEKLQSQLLEKHKFTDYDDYESKDDYDFEYEHDWEYDYDSYEDYMADCEKYKDYEDDMK